MRRRWRPRAPGSLPPRLCLRADPAEAATPAARAHRQDGWPHPRAPLCLSRIHLSAAPHALLPPPLHRFAASNENGLVARAHGGSPTRLAPGIPSTARRQSPPPPSAASHGGWEASTLSLLSDLLLPAPLTRRRRQTRAGALGPACGPVTAASRGGPLTAPGGRTSLRRLTLPSAPRTVCRWRLWQPRPKTADLPPPLAATTTPTNAAWLDPTPPTGADRARPNAPQRRRRFWCPRGRLPLEVVPASTVTITRQYSGSPVTTT